MPTTTDRWEAIARLRSTIRDERVEALARVERLESAAREELARVEGELRQWQDEARAALAGVCDLRRLQHARAGMTALGSQHQAAQAQCVEAKSHVDQAREALLVADREVKVLERLRDKQFAAERAACDREELALMDELART